MAVRTVLFDIIGRDKASSSFRKIGFAAESAAAKVEAASNKMVVAGAKMSKALTLPIVAAVAVSVDQAVKYQRSLNTIQVATDRTDKQMAAGSKGLQRIAQSTGATLDHLTDSFYVAGKGGLSVAKSLAVTKAAAQGAAAEGADLGTVTDALTSIMASYGKTLKSPVAAMNEIVRAAGLAKTTTQDFAESLSNVVPIASALNISFDQVGGAIATMTQHGETAQRATDNLSNLITNLAGQNNVAAQSLGQLGIDTVDLSRHLGERGLTGSLNLVLAAIAKHSKDGLIVTSAFKQSATATASLQTELNQMPPGLRKISDEFDRGKLSYKDYYADVKSLGGQLYQMGKGFLATEGQARGFQNALKNGNSAQRTLASTLKSALGGVTGMRTALMLSGASAKTFASDTQQVSDAAAHAGKNVLGWGKTQQTAAVQAAKLRERLQVMAVTLGTKLLPVVVKAVRFFTGLVDKFTGLPKGVQATIVKILLLAAILGPLIGLVGRLTRGILLLWAAGLASGRFIAGIRGAELSLVAMQSTAYTTGLKVRSAFVRMGGAARVAGAAMTGLAVGVIGGLLVRNADNGTKAIGILGSAAAGAAIGFSVGGPLGAAVGGITAGLSSLATAFIGAGHSAKVAIKPTQEYTDALRQDYDAVGKVTRALLAQELQQKGMFAAGRRVGLTQRQVLDAAMGSTAAVNAYRRAITLAGYGSGEFNQAAGKLAAGLGIVHRELTVNQRAALNIDAALGKTGTTASRLGIDIAALGRSMRSTAAITGAAKASLQAVDKELGLSGLSAAKFADKLVGLAKSGQLTYRQLYELTSFGQINADTAVVLSNILKVHHGLDSLPGSVKTKIDADTSSATWKIKLIQDGINHLHGGTVVLDADARPIAQAILAAENALAALTGGGRKKFPPSIIRDLNRTYGGASHPGSSIGDFGGIPDDSSGGKGTKSKPPKFDKSTLSSLSKSLSGTASGIRTAIHSIIESLRQSKNTVPAFLDKDASQLEKWAKRRTAVAAQLSKATAALQKIQSKYNQLFSSVRSAVTGSFDITTAGAHEQVFNDRAAKAATSGSILKDLNQKVAAASKFERVLHKLRGEGMPGALVQELALAGPGALAQAQALAKSTPAQVAKYRSDYKQLSNVGKDLGTFIAKDTYGAGVKAAQGLVDGLKSKQSLLNKEIRALGKSMIAELEQTLGKGHGHHTPPSHSGGGHGSAAEMHTHYHVHGVQDPQGFLVAARRREQMLAV